MSRRIFAIVSGAIFLGFGFWIACEVLPAAKHLCALSADEGTESFSAAFGIPGLVGCWAFVGLVGILGGAIAWFGISIIRKFSRL